MNKTNGKTYYGSSKELDVRWGKHRTMLRGNYHHCSHLQSSYNKHGEESFEFSIISYCAEQHLKRLEQRLLDEHYGKDYCYNGSKNATAPMAGRKHTKESKAQMSLSKMGANNPMYGTSRTGEQNPFYGKTSPMKGKKQAKVTCPHCGKVGSGNVMKRYHFDRCKQKTPAE